MIKIVHTTCLNVYRISVYRLYCKDGQQKILKRGGKNIQKSCTKKGLNDLDNLDGMCTHLEPDILECEVKWALGSVIMNKASGGDRIPLSYFKS